MDHRFVDLGDGLWANPAHVAFVAAAKDGNAGSVVGFINGLNIARPEPPDEVAAMLDGRPPTVPFPRAKRSGSGPTPSLGLVDGDVSP